jgi:two-component system sensor histidine kinase KdpD
LPLRSRVLLRGQHAAALGHASQRVAEALGVSDAELVVGKARGDRRREAVPLNSGERQIATLLVPAKLAPDVAERMRDQVVPSLQALIAIALERDAIQDEAVQTAALRRSDDLKTAILRSVSHDLRTPLTAILTAGHALGSPSLTDDERRDLSEAVVDEGERLSLLVDKLLDLSKLQSGRAQPRPEWTSLDEVLVAAAEAAGVSDAMRFSIDPARRRCADAAQLERAFANVLENAARHSGEHPVSVRARHVGARLLVRIVDRGPGISEPERERVFEPFHRAPGDDPRHAGAGLGLAIARGFIEANGGSIWIESPPGQGRLRRRLPGH